jgi:hypothetical protein
VEIEGQYPERDGLGSGESGSWNSCARAA